MYAKTHVRMASGFERRIVAICDASLLGRKLEQGEAVLDLKTHRSFYKGVKVTEAAAVELLKGADSCNLVGEKAVAAAKKAFGSALPKKIAGVPHLQIYKV